MEILKKLFTQYTGTEVQDCHRLTAAGSGRIYYRMQNSNTSLIGVIGESAEENNAFIKIAQQLKACNAPVPEVVAVDKEMIHYLQTDLGDTTLYDLMAPCRKSGVWEEKIIEILSATIRQLALIQVEGDRLIDYSICYPTTTLDSRSILMDLNYWKYCFLKATGIIFNENLLQDDFEYLAQILLNTQPLGFMYRDFQSRNIMIHNGQPYFIDFQGGRKGAVYYDVASFLWQARAQYPASLRDRLTDVYIDALRKYYPDITPQQFKENLDVWILFRTLQVLGAYGFRGYYERKELFLQSIPQAIEIIRTLLQKGAVAPYPTLQSILHQVCQLPPYNKHDNRTTLCITIYSFSYKKGLPTDETGNGGGFIFDCRAIHNPGRYAEYANLTGRDASVIDFLEKDGEILTFLTHAYTLVDASVERYLRRGFTHLHVSFGCTGGQHRSVYSAEAMAHHLHSKYNVEVKLIHRERNIIQQFMPI